MAKTMTSVFLLLGFGFLQILSTSALRDSQSANIYNKLERPVDGELEVTLQGAIVLRNNLINILGSFLEYPYLKLSHKYWSSLKEIYDGIRTRRISTIDIVLNIQHYSGSKSAEEQFLGLLNRLEDTVPCRYILDVHRLQFALKTLKFNLNAVLKNITHTVYEGMPHFTRKHLKSMWFSKVSDRIRKYNHKNCDRQSIFNNVILEGIKRKYIPLTTNIFGLLLLNLEYPGISPYGLEKVKHLGYMLLKSSEHKQFDAELKKRFEIKIYKNLYSALQGVLKLLKGCKSVEDNALKVLAESSAQHVEEDPIRLPMPLISQNYNLRSPGAVGVKFSELYKLIHTASFPPDIVEAANVLGKDIAKGYVYKLPVSEQQLLYFEYSEPEALLIALLQRLKLTLPDSNPKAPIIKSILIHLYYKYCRDHGMECSPRSRDELVHLVESFGTMPLDVKHFKLMVDIISLFSKKDLPWNEIIKQLNIYQFRNPRVQFLYIISFILKVDVLKQTFDSEDKCHLKLFKETFVAAEGDVLPPKKLNDTHVEVPLYDRQPQCFARCLEPVESHHIQDNSSKVLEIRPLLFKATTKGRGSNTHVLKKEKLANQLSDRVITRTQKVSFDILLTAFKSTVPQKYITELKRYLTTPLALKELENFNYKLYSNRADLLRNLLLYIRDHVQGNKKLVEVITNSMGYIQERGQGAQGFEVQELYLKTASDQDIPHENLNTLFSGITEKCLAMGDIKVLKGILSHFKSKCINYIPNQRCSLCDAQFIKTWATIMKEQPWDKPQNVNINLNITIIDPKAPVFIGPFVPGNKPTCNTCPNSPAPSPSTPHRTEQTTTHKPTQRTTKHTTKSPSTHRPPTTSKSTLAPQTTKRVITTKVERITTKAYYNSTLKTSQRPKENCSDHPSKKTQTPLPVTTPKRPPTARSTVKLPPPTVSRKPTVKSTITPRPSPVIVTTKKSTTRRISSSKPHVSTTRRPLPTTKKTTTHRTTKAIPTTVKSTLRTNKPTSPTPRSTQSTKATGKSIRTTVRTKPSSVKTTPFVTRATPRYTVSSKKTQPSTKPSTAKSVRTTVRTKPTVKPTPFVTRSTPRLVITTKKTQPTIKLSTAKSVRTTVRTKPTVKTTPFFTKSTRQVITSRKAQPTTKPSTAKSVRTTARTKPPTKPTPLVTTRKVITKIPSTRKTQPTTRTSVRSTRKETTKAIILTKPTPKKPVVITTHRPTVRVTSSSRRITHPTTPSIATTFKPRVPPRATEVEICEETTSNIWTISSVHIDIISILNAIPKYKLPQDKQNLVNQLYRLFSNKHINFNTLVQGFNIKKYKHRGEFLRALLEFMETREKVTADVKAVISKVKDLVRTDGLGAKPIDIVDVDAQYHARTKFSATTVAIDIDDLLGKLKSSRENAQAIAKFFNFLATSNIEKYTYDFDFEKYSTKLEFVTNFLKVLKANQYLKQDIRQAIITIEPQITKIYKPNELVIYNFYTDPVENML